MDAQVYESWYKTRKSIVSMVKPGDPTAPSVPLFDRYALVNAGQCSSPTFRHGHVHIPTVILTMCTMTLAPH